jgi:NitT/TauT family transport system permease protein
MLGALFGQFSLIRRIFGPWLTASFTVPKIVLYPILLFVFGLGATSRIAYVVLHAAPAIVLFTLAGMLAVTPGHLKYAASLQLSTWQAFRHISLPSALPEIISGLRFGLGTCLLGVLVAEMVFGAGEGAGFAIMESAIAADTARLMALIVGVFMMVLLANYFMAVLRRIALHSTSQADV